MLQAEWYPIAIDVHTQNAQLTSEFDLFQCTESVNVTYDALSECKTGPKGVELQLAAEKETNDAGVEYVPFVVFNHVSLDFLSLLFAAVTMEITNQYFPLTDSE